MSAWTAIPGFSRYQVSRVGRIRAPRGELSPVPNHGGYQRVRLVDDHGRKRTMRVHRIVMAAFVGPARGREVAHLNGDKTDNRLSNLCYATRRLNESHKRDHGTCAGGGRREPTLPERVETIRLSHREGMSFSAIARIFDLHRTSVARIVKGERHRRVA